MLPLFGLRKRNDILQVGELKNSTSVAKKLIDDDWIIAESEQLPDSKRKISMKDTKSVILLENTVNDACTAQTEVGCLRDEVQRLQSMCTALQYRIVWAETERDMARLEVSAVKTATKQDANGSFIDFVQVLKTLLLVTFELERSLVNALCDVLLAAFDKCAD